jgi:hypothetical protein
MGVVATEAVFDGRAPQLSRIAAQVTEMTGLPVSVAESGPDVTGELYDLHGHLAFACAPGTGIELHSYRAGAAREFCRQTFGDAHFPVARFVEGLNEPPGTQAVYVRGYVGQEPTLFFATLLALEALGGRPREPFSDEDRREYGSPISPAELEERRRKLTRHALPAVLIGLVLLPVLIPLWVVGLLWFLVSMPWRIWRGYQLYCNYADGHGVAQ